MGGKGRAVVEFALDGALSRSALFGSGGDHVLDGRDAGERKGERNVIVVAELALGMVGDPTSTSPAAAEARYRVAFDNEPVEER